MVFIQLSKAMLLGGITSGANSSVQHVAPNTQKDFVAQDTLSRAATSFKTKPCVRKKKRGGGNQQIFQRMCKKSKPLIFFFLPVSHITLYSANPHRFFIHCHCVGNICLLDWLCVSSWRHTKALLGRFTPRLPAEGENLN